MQLANLPVTLVIQYYVFSSMRSISGTSYRLFCNQLSLYTMRIMILMTKMVAKYVLYIIMCYTESQQQLQVNVSYTHTYYTICNIHTHSEDTPLSMELV